MDSTPGSHLDLHLIALHLGRTVAREKSRGEIRTFGRLEGVCVDEWAVCLVSLDLRLTMQVPGN